jgi:uncharacterized membrane protein YphA (DoxX/SURF4 family)
MAVDQASTRDGKGEPAITGFVRAVTQPGGMNIDWRRVAATGSIIGGIAVIYGLKTRRWRYIHTSCTVLVIAAEAAAHLKDRYFGAARGT